MAKKGKKRSRSAFEDEVVETYMKIQHALVEATRRPEDFILNEEMQLRLKRVWANLRRAQLYAMEPDAYMRIYRSADVHTTEAIAGLEWNLTVETVADQLGIPREEVLRRAEAGKVGIQSAERLQAGLQETFDTLPGLVGRIEKPGDPERYRDSIMAAANAIKPPAVLPFESMFVCIGRIRLTDIQIDMRFPGNEDMIDRSRTDAHLLGFLMFFDGEEFCAYELIEYIRKEMLSDVSPAMALTTGDKPTGNFKSVGITAVPVRDFDLKHEPCWTRPLDLNPWIVNAIADMYNQNQTVLVRKPWSLSQKTMRERKIKADKIDLPIPKPYYTLKIRGDRVTEIADDTVQRLNKRSFQYSYQFKVQGHDRCKVRRGKLPMEPKTYAKLRDRGYVIYIFNNPGPSDAYNLARRKQPPKRKDEWLAIKTTRVAEHTKGPEDAPFVPALRKAV